MKTLIIILVTAVVVGGLATGYFLKFHGGGSVDMKTPVRVELANLGDLVESVSAPGQVEPKTKVSISAKVSARIVALPLKVGDTVTRGDPKATPPVEPSILLRLDAKDLEAQLRGAEAHYQGQSAQLVVAGARIRSQEAGLEASKVLLADAARDLARQKDLLTTKDVSQSVVDAAEAKYEQLKAQLDASARNIEADRSNLEVVKHELEAADAEIAQARDSLSYTTITSPLDGVVTRVNSQVGELVVIGTMNNPGTVIMEVADLNTMIVNARIDEASVAQVKLGQKAEVRSQAYPDEVFEGVVSAVALAETEEKDGSKYFKTEVTLKTSGKRVLSGLTADLEIETARHQNIIAVPTQCVLGRAVDELPMALRNDPTVDKSKTLTTVVYRLIDGKAVVTPVKVGPSDATRTVILAGVNPGEQIIAGPYKVLEHLTNDQAVMDEKTVTTQPTTKP